MWRAIAHHPIEAALAAATLSLLLVGLIGWLLSARGRFCPGTSRTWRAMLPQRWFLVRACGYDLAGLPTPCRCPECGRVTRGVGRRLWSVRLGRVGVVLGTASAIGVRTDYIRRGSWAWDLPALAAVSIEASLGDETPLAVRMANADRVRRACLSPGQASTLARALVRELGDDAIDLNASRARTMLAGLGPSAYPALHAGLLSADRQRRQHCAHVLVSAEVPATEALLRVGVEALASDNLDVSNARAAAWYLMWRADQAARHLRLGMASEDPQQRLFSAIVAGFGSQGSLASSACPILIEHLADNEVEGDARVAAAALFEMGEPARQFLQEAAIDADAQVRDTASLILLELDGPAATPDDRRARRALNRVTRVSDSPTRGHGVWDMGSIRFPPGWTPRKPARDSR